MLMMNESVRDGVGGVGALLGYLAATLLPKLSAFPLGLTNASTRPTPFLPRFHVGKGKVRFDDLFPPILGIALLREDHHTSVRRRPISKDEFARKLGMKLEKLRELG